MTHEANPPASAFMLLFRSDEPNTHGHLSAEEREQLARQWNAWYDGLTALGKVVHGQPLAMEGRVVSGPRGRNVMDGPYAETKEVVGGYFFLSVADIDEATAIAQQCPSLSLGLKVEVRPVAAVSPVLAEVHGRPPRGNCDSAAG